VLIDDGDQIIAGHGRVEAAKLIGLAVVPTLRLSHLSAAEKRAYILADNRLAEKAGWDREILAIELQALIDLDFDVELTGFETAISHPARGCGRGGGRPRRRGHHPATASRCCAVASAGIFGFSDPTACSVGTLWMRALTSS